MKFGTRVGGNRADQAIGSMINGTIGGFSRIGMPIVEVLRRPVPPVADCECAVVDTATWNPDYKTANVTIPTSLTLAAPSTGDVYIASILSVVPVVSAGGMTTIVEIVDTSPGSFTLYAYLLIRPADSTSTTVTFSGGSGTPAIGIVGGYPAGDWSQLPGSNPVEVDNLGGGSIIVSVPTAGQSIVGMLVSAQDSGAADNLGLLDIPDDPDYSLGNVTRTTSPYRLDMVQFVATTAVDPTDLEVTLGNANQYRWAAVVGCDC